MPSSGIAIGLDLKKHGSDFKCIPDIGDYPAYSNCNNLLGTLYSLNSFKYVATTLNQAPQMALVVKNSPISTGNIRDWSQSLGQEDSLEKGMETHSRILAWGIPWTE